MKINAMYEYINQSIDFAAKFTSTKNGFPKEVSHCTNIKNEV